MVKNLPAMQEPQETQIQSLCLEDPLVEEMATHSSILAWRGSPWTEEPDGLQPMGSQLNQVSKHIHVLEGPQQNLAQEGQKQDSHWARPVSLSLCDFLSFSLSHLLLFSPFS